MLKKSIIPASWGGQVRLRSQDSSLGSVSMAGFSRHSGGLSFMKRLDAYAVVYLLDGSGRYKDAQGLDLPVRSGDMMLVFPGLPHMYGPGEGEAWTQIYLVFDGPVFRLWQSSGLLDPARPILRAEPVDYWLKRLESVLETPRRAGQAPPLVEACRLQLLLAELCMGAGRGAAPAGMEMITRACALLESDLEREMDLEELAKELGCSYVSFRKRFTQAMGMPPAKYRSMRVADRACQLMQRGFNGKQIAQALGFSDEYHFSRRFKGLMGCSPREFRRRIKQLP